MKVALVYPFIKITDYSCNPPVSLLYLATSLRAKGFEVAVFDRDGYTGGLGELLDKIVNYRPDVCGMPIYTSRQAFQDVKTLCQGLRNKLPNTRILVGGPHATACPEETLRWFPQVDFLLQGESDHTICDLMRQLDGNAAKLDVPGLWYRNDCNIVGTPVGKAPKDLDLIPIPDRRLIWDNYRKGLYWRIDRKGIVDYLLTGRGCPFNCKFCFKVERGYRPRSPENVVRELEYLASLGIKAVDFEDDLFTVDKARCIEICRMIRDARLGLRLKVRSRVDTIDKDILSAMRECGVKAVVYGFESGSQKLLEAMGKNIKIKRSYEVVRITKKARLGCYADIFIGFPGETLETLAETEKFLLTARPTTVNMSILAPFPGTAVYLEARSNGTLVGDWSPDDPQPYVRLPWAKDHTALRDIQKRIVHKFYTRPSALFMILLYAGPRLSLRTWTIALRFFRRIVRA